MAATRKRNRKSRKNRKSKCTSRKNRKSKGGMYNIENGDEVKQIIEKCKDELKGTQSNPLSKVMIENMYNENKHYLDNI